jgi:hypothetical protein
MDQLGVQHSVGVYPDTLYVEVQASFRPNNRVARLVRQRAKDFGVSRTIAISRTPETVWEVVGE